VGKEYELKCLLDNKEKEKEVVIEAVAETVDVVVVEVDSAVVVVDVEVAHEAEAEVENADVLDGHHPTGQCQKVEVDQLHHHPGDDDLDQPPARINTH